VRPAPLFAGVVILWLCGGPAHAAVREVDSMPTFAQLGAGVTGKPTERQLHEQKLVALVKRGEDAQALAYVGSVAARQPALAAELHEAMAGAYVRDRRLYRATQHLDAIPAARRSVQAQFLVGHIAARQQRLEPALQAFERLSRKLPEDPLVARDEAQIAALMAQPARASAACERLLSARPGDVEATLLLARLRISQAAWRTRSGCSRESLHAHHATPAPRCRWAWCSWPWASRRPRGRRWRMPVHSIRAMQRPMWPWLRSTCCWATWPRRARRPPAR